MTPDQESVVTPATCAVLHARTRDSSVTAEIGCGPAQYRNCVNGHYVGIDLTGSPYRVDMPREPDVLGDAHEVPLRDRSVDLVLFSHTFCLIPDQGKAVGEAARVLRSGGWLLIADYSPLILAALTDRYGDPVPQVGPARWRALLGGDEWHNTSVRMHTPSRLKRLLQHLAPTPAIDAAIERRKVSVLVTARRRTIR